MVFPRLGRSLWRSARSRIESGALLGGYGVRSALLNETLLSSPCVKHDNAGLGLLRGYLTSIGARTSQVPKSRIGDWNSLFANPKFRRLFSSESPDKKKYENYYPKYKNELPKGKENNKSNSKVTDDDGVTLEGKGKKGEGSSSSRAITPGPKSRWTEVVGITLEEAKEVWPTDSYVTADYNLSRVRLFVDSSGKVARIPSPGKGEGSSITAGPKRRWPEVVGLTVEEAKETIKRDLAHVYFEVLPPDITVVTADYISSRVRLRVDSSGKVDYIPILG